MAGEATRLVTADVAAEDPKIQDTAKADEETLEGFTGRHRTVRIPDDKREYYLEVKFRSLKSSSHILNNLMEAVQIPMEEEDVKAVKNLHMKWVKNYDELLETDDQYRLMMTEEEESDYHKKWYRQKDLEYSTFKAELEKWLLEREESSKDYLSDVSRSNSLRSLTSSTRLESDQKLAELAVKQRTLKAKMKIEQERLNLTMKEEELKLQTEIDIEEAKSRILDRASSIGSVKGSPQRSQASELTEDHVETVKAENKIKLRCTIPGSPRTCNVQSSPMGTLPGKSRNSSVLNSPLNNLPQMSKTSSVRSQEDFVSFVKIMNKPKVNIKPFRGDPLHYHRFLRQFHSTVSNNCDNTEEKLELLGQYTEGDANAVIKGYLSMVNSEAAYQAALEELQERYGDPEIMVTAYVQKVIEWPAIRADSPRELDMFAIFLAECEHAVASVDAIKILEYSENVKKIISKLPFGLHDKWRNLVYQLKERKQSVNFTQLVQFVRREARKANDPLFGRDALKDITKGKEQYKSSKVNNPSRAKGAFATKTEITEVKKTPSADGGASARLKYTSGLQGLANAFTAPCANCNDTHPMEMCKKLSSLSYNDRLQVLKQKAFCYGCLRTGHRVRDCRNRATCTHCKKRHPSILHVDGGPQRSRDSASTPQVVGRANVGVQGSKEPDVTMAVVPVRVGRQDGAFSCMTYAFMDPGSNISFMSESLQREIGCQGARKRLSMETMGVRHVMNTSAVKGIHITGLDGKHVVGLPTLYTKDTIPVSKEHIPTTKDISQWPHLEGIVLPEVDAEIGLLLGNNAPDVYSPIEVLTGPSGSPHVTKTRIGLIAWNVIRSENSASSSECNTHMVNQISATVSEFEEGQRLEKLYQKSVALDFSERLTEERPENSREDKCFLEILNTSKRFTDGHYVFSLPLKKQVVLPDNRTMALSRLSSLQKRMLRDPQYRKDYMNFMAVLLEKKYAERVPAEEKDHQNGRTWYLPHHGVYHPQKKKLRVVFDCSARHQGVSLNDVLYQGPDLANSLISVLAKFRQEQIAITGDVEKMFYQVQVTEDNRDCMRFYWWEDGNIETDPKIYRMTVHIFGAASSPSVANFALQQVFQDNQYGSALSNSPVRNFYVDDYLCSFSTIDEAISNIRDVTSLCQKGGFRLTKWQSNQQAVLDRVPETERASSDSLYERTLGIMWDVESDSFHFRITPSIDAKVTRRKILSEVSSVYDPLGLISPFLLPAKFILQDLCRRNFDWDTILSGQLLGQWDSWVENISNSDFIIPRCHKPSHFGSLRNAQLHMFSDASEKGYGVAVYIRLEDDVGRVHCSLVMGKSRVAPIKQQTIPRLELAAATTAVRLSHQIQKILEPEYAINEVLYWTDSMAVIRYITNQSSRYQTFVANRLAVIHDGSEVSEWHYVNTMSNPADHASRGIAPDQKKTEWFTGPDFLWRDCSQWPNMEQICGSLSLEPGDPELKRSVNSIKVTETSVVDHAIEVSSRWMKVKRIVAAVLLAQQKFHRNNLASVTDRLQKAESLIIRHEQQLYFAEELKDLSVGSTVKKASPLHGFNSFLKDGIIRIGGRLQHATLPFDSKHQIVLPRTSRVSRLILEDIHRRVGHLGKNTITAYLRQNFWILGSAALIRNITSKCVTCRKYQARSCEQQMADLPIDRVCPDEPPFTRVGVDFFGPIEIKRGRSVVKRYGVIFTCLAIRAVHLEVAFSMDTDSCINAIRRFIARRGPVKFMVSDNGTNLVAAETELKREIQSLDKDRLSAAFQCENIKWHFNPPSGSHFGGVWERLIRSVRKVMYSVLKEQVIRLDDEGLQTLFCEVEAILNGRPITTISEDHREPEALTPNHLLIFHPGQDVPVGTFDKNDCYSRRRWRQIQFLSDQFWKRWLREYLPSLQKRQKWCKPRRNIEVDDLVLVVESSPRNSWPLARVTEVFKDHRGLVRRVTVRTRGSTYLQRPVDKLVLLMEGDGTGS